MKRSQVRWLAHLLTKSGTSTLPQEKTRVGRPRLCQQRLDLTWPDVIASVKDRTRWKRLSVSRRANENKTFAFRFPIQWHCLLVSRFVNYFYHGKVQRTFSSSFLLLSTESSVFSLSYQENQFLFSHWFISNSVWNQRDKGWRSNSFFLTVKSQTQNRWVKCNVFRSHTLVYRRDDGNEILARFLTDNKYFFTQLNLVEWKIHRTSKDKHRTREKFHWSIVIIATFHICLLTLEIRISSHFDTGKWADLMHFQVLSHTSNEWLLFFLLRQILLWQHTMIVITPNKNANFN